jgi:hypothetical protein
VKLIVAGSRSITDYECLRWALVDSGIWKAHKKSIEVVCGMAKGADALGLDFAKKNGLQWHPFPADWDDIKAPGAVVKVRSDGVMYNARAGHDRNQRMADFADALLLLWDGKSTGSRDMHSRAIKKGLSTHAYRFSGHPLRPPAIQLDHQLRPA